MDCVKGEEKIRNTQLLLLKQRTVVVFVRYQDDEQNRGMWAHPTGYLQKGSGGSQIKGNMLEPLAISEGRIWLTRTQITEADYWSLLG